MLALKTKCHFKYKHDTKRIQTSQPTALASQRTPDSGELVQRPQTSKKHDEQLF